MLYVYAKAKQMKAHKFNDDVAIVYAKNKQQALQKFLDVYSNATIKDIIRVKIKHLNDVMILTDY